MPAASPIGGSPTGVDPTGRGPTGGGPLGRSPLEGRHAVVTGGGRGIGAVVAQQLVADGARVSLLGRDPQTLERTAAALGDRALAVAADVADERSVDRAFTAARARFGPVQVLVNNAGQAASAKFTATDPALWQRIIGVNLTGSYLCTRQAVADMLQGGFGRIVNVASIAGLRGAAYISAYVASKHGLIGLTRSLALELATHGITVNAVCPGYTDTDIVRAAVANIAAKTGRTPEQALATLTATNPQGRLVTPEEVAHAILWLVRPGTESINGQSIVINGGEG